MPQLGLPATRLNRADALARFAANRRRTRAMFDLLDQSVYYARPISLRNPVVFYEGHVPAFSVNALIKSALGQRGVDPHLETIFARGIDPESEASSIARGNPAWPSRDVVRQYVDAADALIADAIRGADLERPGDPKLDHARALWTILEHEEMHQETLGYIWHQVPFEHKRKPVGYETAVAMRGRVDTSRRVTIPGGVVTLGTDLQDEEVFAWDNELPVHRVGVEAFSIDAYNVTNAQFLDFVDAGGYREPAWWRPEDWAWVQSEAIEHPLFWQREREQWFYRGMFERVSLPETWPVYVTWAEASAFARWRGLRLPTEAEYHRAAFGTPSGRERRYAWGDGDVVAAGNFDFMRWDPEPVGSHAPAVSAFGVHDLVGNGWEWTSTVFGPFEGFAPIPTYPEYSADFFDGEHFVMKGASPLTARPLVRRGFRNWFRPRYPYVHATFRCVGEA